MEIIPLFASFAPLLKWTTIKQLSRIVRALLVMTGRVTMLGMSRWAGEGGSYRTIQRFFYTQTLPWAALFWTFFRDHLYHPGAVYLLAGDEVVVTKAGKTTHGLERFYSSIYGKPVPGLAFFALSLINVETERSSPILLEQVLRAPGEKTTPPTLGRKKSRQSQALPASAAPETGSPAVKRPRGRPQGSKNKPKPAPSAPIGEATAPSESPAAQLEAPPIVKRPPGRPKGSKNKPKPEPLPRDGEAKTVAVPKGKREPELGAELQHIQKMVQTVQAYIAPPLAVTYLVMDGHFGNHKAAFMTQACHLELISKLRYDAELYLPYVGEHSGPGRPRIYGDRLYYDQLPASSLRSEQVAGPIQTRIYQMECLHKDFAAPLNVVVIVKTNLTTGAWAHVILFSTDLQLPDAQLIQYYHLRFQIEFNFRDAKQYWGLEDFMNVTETAVTNAANLALFMVDVSQPLLDDFRQTYPAAGILDLKSHYRGLRYVEETIKILPQKPEPFLLVQILDRVTSLGRIHAVSGAPPP
jgi:putative transposase